MTIPVIYTLLLFYISTSWAPGVLSITEDVSAPFAFVGAMFLAIIVSKGRSTKSRLDIANWRSKTKYNYPIELRTIIIASCCLMYFAAASLLWVDQPFRVFRVIYGYFAGIITTFVIIRYVRTSKKLNILIFVTVLCGVGSSLIVAAAYWLPSLGAIFFGSSDRTAGLFKQKNQFGLALAATLPYALAMAFTLKKKGLGWFFSLSILLGIVFSGSKTNLVISSALATVCLVAFTLLKRGNTKILLVIALPFLFLILGPLFLYALEFFSPRALSTLQRASGGEIHELSTMEIRYEAWRESIKSGLKSPLTGDGVGTYVLDLNHSHNVLMDYFRTMGFPGLLFVSLVIFASIWYSMKCIIWALKTNEISTEGRHFLIAASMSIISYISSNMMSDSFGPWTFYIYWTSLGIIASIRINKLGYFNESSHGKHL